MDHSKFEALKLVDGRGKTWWQPRLPDGRMLWEWPIVAQFTKRRWVKTGKVLLPSGAERARYRWRWVANMVARDEWDYELSQQVEPAPEDGNPL